MIGGLIWIWSSPILQIAVQSPFESCSPCSRGAGNLQGYQRSFRHSSCGLSESGARQACSPCWADMDARFRWKRPARFPFQRALHFETSPIRVRVSVAPGKCGLDIQKAVWKQGECVLGRPSNKCSKLIHLCRCDCVVLCVGRC